MNITFYNFTKRLNSTKVVASTGTQATVVLKETSSLTRPIIRLQSASRPTYNYAYIGDFGRYYYVHEWTWRDGLWEVELEIDALASWKTAIGNFSTYVLRSSHSSDLYVRDSIYPGKCKFSTSKSQTGNPWTIVGGAGCYVIGVIAPSSESSAVGGAATYYAITKSNLNNLIQQLLGTITTELGLIEIDYPDTALLAKSISNPLQWIKCCQWIPYVPSLGSPENVWLGLWDTGVQGYPVTGKIAHGTTLNVSLPNHPQITRGKWLNSAPYRRLSLDAGPFGSIELPTDILQEVSTIALESWVDSVTGDGGLQISCAGYEKNYYAKLGVELGLAQIYSSAHQFINATTDIAAGAAGAVQSGIKLNVSGAIDSAGRAANGIVDMAEAIQGMPSSAGSDGSYAALYQPMILNAVFMEIVDEDNARLGRPLCQIKTLSTIPGFIQVAEGDVDCEATLAEKATIKSYLEGGFYYE